MAWRCRGCCGACGPLSPTSCTRSRRGCPCPAVLTVQDLSFERDPAVMSARSAGVFRTVVPWSARRAAGIFAISERTRDDLVELYGIPRERIVVTPLGVDPDFRPGGVRGDYLLFVGAIEPRKDPLAAARAARAVGLPLVVVGPVRDQALARALREEGADLRGYVRKEELVRLYQEAACVVFPSRYEGFGLPLRRGDGLRDAGRRTARRRRCARWSATRRVRRRTTSPTLCAGRSPTAERLSAAGLERAKRFTWEETARRTAEVYRELLA